MSINCNNNAKFAINKLLNYRNKGKIVTIRKLQHKLN